MPVIDSEIAVLAGLSGVGLNQNYVTDTVVFRSRFDLGGAAPQYPGDLRRGAIATPNPDDLGWGSKQDASLGKIGVLRNDGNTVLPSVFPDAGIVCSRKPQRLRMR